MLGFSPVAGEMLSDKDLLVINRALAAYQAWHALLDGFIWLEPRTICSYASGGSKRKRACGKKANRVCRLNRSRHSLRRFCQHMPPTTLHCVPGLPRNLRICEL
jgi:hypothetical protein